MNNLRRKIDLYVLSLALLFLFFIIMTVDLPLCFGAECVFVGIRAILLTNTVAVISIVLLGYCAFAYSRFNFDLAGSTDIPFEITRIESRSFEHLTFLATYVVPLISFDFSSPRQMTVLALLLVVMGAIYIKTDLFYANPSLALFGFHIYKANGNFKNGDRENLVLLSRDRLTVGHKVAYIKLDERIYFAKGIENE